MKQIYIFGDSILKGVTYSEEAGRHFRTWVMK